MKFEYDSGKSKANKEKHGIDFEEAQKLWRGLVLMVSAKAGSDEARYLTIGRIGSTYWAAVTTPRGAAIRIISVRHARREEVRAYEQAIQGIGYRR